MREATLFGPGHQQDRGSVLSTPQIASVASFVYGLLRLYEHAAIECEGCMPSASLWDRSQLPAQPTYSAEDVRRHALRVAGEMLIRTSGGAALADIIDAIEQHYGLVAASFLRQEWEPLGSEQGAVDFRYLS